MTFFFFFEFIENSPIQELALWILHTLQGATSIFTFSLLPLSLLPLPPELRHLTVQGATAFKKEPCAAQIN